VRHQPEVLIRQNEGVRAKVLAAGLLLLACMAGCRGAPRAGSAPSVSAPQSSTAPSPSCAPTGTALRVIAKDIKFSTDCLAVPANTPFTIAFENQDPGVTHNVAIHTGYWMYSVAAPWLFMGGYITGTATTTYHVAGLHAGSYVFMCDVHHDQMTGHLLVAEP